MNKKLLVTALLATLSGAVSAEQKVVAGYFADWQYKNADNPYVVEDIPAEQLTHVIYCVARIQVHQPRFSS